MLDRIHTANNMGQHNKGTARPIAGWSSYSSYLAVCSDSCGGLDHPARHDWYRFIPTASGYRFFVNFGVSMLDDHRALRITETILAKAAPTYEHFALESPWLIISSTLVVLAVQPPAPAIAQPSEFEARTANFSLVTTTGSPTRLPARVAVSSLSPDESVWLSSIRQKIDHATGRSANTSVLALRVGTNTSQNIITDHQSNRIFQNQTSKLNLSKILLLAKIDNFLA